MVAQTRRHRSIIEPRFRLSSMDISIICVNWNSADYLRNCIASIYEQTQGVSFEIIVVDNASPQGGVEVLQEEFPETIIIKSEKNLGFAAANNLGFRNSCGEYVLLLNPDTKIVGPAIFTMWERLNSLPEAGVVGCRLLNSDLSVQLTAIQKFPTILNQLLDLEYLQRCWPNCVLWDMAPLFSDKPIMTEVEVISGACMMLRRAVFEHVGLFTEDYFMYAEDIDLNYKVSQAGFKNYYVGEATVVHYGGKSSSKQEVSHWATIMKYRAMRKLFQNTRGRFYASLYRVAMACSAVGRLALLSIAYPLGNVLWTKKSVQIAMKKWGVILRWSLGLQSPVVGD